MQSCEFCIAGRAFFGEFHKLKKFSGGGYNRKYEKPVFLRKTGAFKGEIKQRRSEQKKMFLYGGIIMKKRFAAWILTLSVLLTAFSPLSAMAASHSEIQNRMIEILYAGEGGHMSCDFDGYVTTSGRHEGIDFARTYGARIHSISSGTVTRVTNSSDLSTLAIYDASNNKTVVYLHGHYDVSVGDTISQGQYIGTEAKNGASSAHTHVEVRNGKKTSAAVSVGDPVLDNPNPYSYWESVVSGTSNHLPELSVDVVQGGQGKVHVQGWAFDPDSPSKTVEVHVYIDGEGHAISANQERTDVNAVYGCGNYHGFSADIATSKTGSVSVDIYAIDNEDSSQHAGPDQSTTTITAAPADTTGPTLSNYKVTNKDSSGYTISCTVTDPSGVDHVAFKTWTTAEGESKARIENGTRSGDNYTYRVKKSDHSNATKGYMTYVLAYDKCGNVSGIKLSKELDLPIDPTGISLNKTSLSFTGTGASQKLSATVSPSDATDKTVTWTSSNTAVATVSGGTVKAAGYGTATITAKTVNGKTATCKVTVVQPSLTGISVSSKPTKISYYVGDTLNTSGLKLKATYNNGSTQTISSGFTCTPTALKTAGTQTITVNYAGKTTSFTVTVQAVAVTGVSVSSKPNKTSYYVGDTLNTAGLSLKVSYNNGSSKTITSGFTCTPTALKNTGTQTITVNYGGKTTSFSVTVAKASRAAPHSLQGKAPSAAGAADGKITGTTNAMEWAAKGSSNYKTCPNGELTGLTAGTYLVRYAETSTHLKSSAVEVTVPAYAEDFQQLTLHFDPNGGIVDQTEKSVYRKETFGRLPEPTASGYVFTGWYTDRYDGEKITSLMTCNLTKDSTVYAHWAPASAAGWSFDNNTGTLTVDCSGAMEEYASAADTPWYAYRSGVRKVIVKSGVTALSSYAFYGCDELVSVSLPDTLQKIGSMAFYNCSNLTEIQIPESVTAIDSYAFADCSGLKTVTFAGDAPEFGTGVFTSDTLSAYYPAYAAGWELVVGQNYGFGAIISWSRGGSAAFSLESDEAVVWTDAESVDDTVSLDWTL